MTFFQAGVATLTFSDFLTLFIPRHLLGFVTLVAGVFGFLTKDTNLLRCALYKQAGGGGDVIIIKSDFLLFLGKGSFLKSITCQLDLLLTLHFILHKLQQVIENNRDEIL